MADKKLKFWTICSNKRLRPSATVHLTGRLGFNRRAAEMMDLVSRPHFGVATKRGDASGETLYLVKQKDHLSIKTGKMGRYYNLNLARFFNRMVPTDYKSQKVIYDIEASDYDGKPMFILKRRILPRKKKRTNRR